MGLISLLVGGAIDANRAIKENKAKNDDGVQTVKVKNLYSIDVPSFLSPTTRLSEDASLQYWNKTLDISMQIVDESKSEFIESLEELKESIPSLSEGSLVDNLATISLSNVFDMDKVELGNYTETEINGLKAVTVNAFQSRTFFKDAVYGSFAFIEGKETLYQIMILSGGTSIRKLADKLELSINSFKEL